MLNWSIEKCQEMSKRIVEIVHELDHENKVIMYIISKNYGLAKVYEKRIYEINSKMDVLLALEKTIYFHIKKEMDDIFS